MTTHKIEELLAIMARLRDPETGCPWDIKQDFSTIAPHTIEEAYEVADAIERNDMDDFKEELGDLLLQIVFQAQMAKEKSLFDFDDVAAAISEKLIRRHPHIFGEASAENADDVIKIWEAKKDEERARKSTEEPSVLNDIPRNFPALMRALKIQKRMASVGFDWSQIEDVLKKLDEEVAEIRAEIESGDMTALQAEFGDLLFVMVNLARHLKIDPETALRQTNDKVDKRFRHIETSLAKTGTTPKDVSLETMEALWQEAKAINE